MNDPELVVDIGHSRAERVLYPAILAAFAVCLMAIGGAVLR